MKEKFSQKDYFLYPLLYEKILVILGKELETIERSEKKTLWYYSAKETSRHLEKEKGANLTPHDVNNIVSVLLKYTKE